MILTTTQESLVILFYDRGDPPKVICDLIAVFFLQMIEYVQFFWPFSSGCLPRLRDFQREAFEKKRPKGQRLPFEMVSTHCIPYMLAYGSTLVIYQVADFS